MKKYIAIFTLTAILLCLLTACGGSAITVNEAQQIVMKDLGVSANDVQDIHSHVMTEGGKPSYSIHVTVGENEYEYVISSDGKILSSGLISE